MRTFLMIAALFSASACEQTKNTASLDLNYARTSLGFRNSGDLSSGRLYLWDLNEENLTLIAAGIGLPERTPNQPGNREATSVSGFAIQAGADVNGQGVINISQKVEDSLSFSSTNALTIENNQLETAMSSTYSALRSQYQSDPSNTANPYISWRVEDATSNQDRYKYVLLYNEVQASAEFLKFEGSIESSVSFDVPNGASGNVAVSITSTATQSCTETVEGERAVCYINAKVYNVFLNDSRNLDYSPISTNNLDLAEALRAQ
jgi:hypothetical protein